MNKIINFKMLYVRRDCYGGGTVFSGAILKANSSYVIYHIPNCLIYAVL